MSSYRGDPVYIALEKLCKAAGVTVIYQEVPDDSIDGAIWARAECDMRAVMMPQEDDAFPSAEKAGHILGHELAHVLLDIDSPDDIIQREQNEAICDFVGVAYYRLAESIAMNESEQAFIAATK